MYIVMCLDDDNGVLFNNRRQSRDAKVSADIFKTSKGRLFISEYSKTLFKRFEGVTVGEEFPYCAEDGDYCFAECEITKDAAEKAEGFIIYRWNRKYPKDVSFDISLEELGFKLEETKEFKGSCHDKITKEVFKR